MNLLDKFHFKDKNGIKTTMEICDSLSRSKISEVVGMIPTKVSQLFNDSGFITSADVPSKTSELQNDSGFITSADVPTKTSELQNDSGFITSADVPTKTSELQNDSNYATTSQLPNTSYIGAGGWGRQMIGTTALLFTMTDQQSINFTQLYGSDYWTDVTFNIPAEVRLGLVINTQVSALAGMGLLNCTIVSVNTSSITLRVSNKVAGAIDVRFNISMCGGV